MSSCAKSDKDASTSSTTSADVHSAKLDTAVTSSMFVFTADKAGMKGVDKQHVQEVVHRMSKDSSFYQKSLRDNEKVEQRVVAMRKKLLCLSYGQLQRLQDETDARIAQMEATQDLSRIIAVVDMDMFYAAVEMRDNPKLRDVPLAVGGMNMISTANYAARQYGVRAAMPGFIGKELCPELQFVPVKMEKYKGVADQIRTVFAEYDPDFEAFSLDEACLDLTNYVSQNWQKYALAVEKANTRSESDDEQQWATTTSGRAAIAAAIVRELRKKIFDCTQLTASAGIAVNVMLAKICSDMNKPNGQYVLPFTRECITTFIRKLPVRKIGGIGKVTEKLLKDGLDVHTGADLFAQRGRIAYLFSKKTADWLLQTSLGLRERREKQDRKSISRERTFPSLSDPKQLESKCKEICQMLAQDLEKADKATKNVTLIYKDTAFSRCSRSMTLVSAVFTANDLFANAVELLHRDLPLTLRLMGVRAATLVLRPKSPSAVKFPQTEMGSKKRQIVINKFAEKQVDGPAFALASDGSESNDQNMVKKKAKVGKYVPAVMTATFSNQKECFARMQCVKLRCESAEQCGLHTQEGNCIFKEAAERPRTKKKTTMPLVHMPSLSRPYPMSTLEVDNKPCPICGTLLNVKNNMEVNAHIDVCVVSKKTFALSSPLRRTTHRKLKKTAISSAFARVQDHSRRAGENAKPCPICGKVLNTCNSIEVNVHMDNCVTRDNSHPKRSIGEKRRKHEASKTKLENSIRIFFRANSNDD